MNEWVKARKTANRKIIKDLCSMGFQECRRQPGCGLKKMASRYDAMIEYLNMFLNKENEGAAMQAFRAVVNTTENGEEEHFSAFFRSRENAENWVAGFNQCDFDDMDHSVSEIRFED